MRDFRQEIDFCNDFDSLREMLDELAEEIEQLDGLSYEDEPDMSRIHDLELVLRYGEHKLEQLLA